MSVLHSWTCPHIGCQEFIEGLGVASLALHVQNHNKAFHPLDYEITAENIILFDSYKSPAPRIMYSRERTQTVPAEYRQPTTWRPAEYKGDAASLTPEDRTFLAELKIKW